MKIQKIVVTMVSAFSLSLSLAQAQYYWYLPEGAGPLFRMGIGPSFYQDGTLRGYTLEGAGPVTPQKQPVNYDTGFTFDAAVGWAFDKYVALDFESGYTEASINNVHGYYANGSTIGNIPFLGDITLSLPIPNTGIIPYIGGGAGGAVSEFDAHSFRSPGYSPTYTTYGSESDTVFAYQAFAGVQFMLTPNLSLGLGYKYFATGNPTFSYPPSPNLNMSFDGVRAHSIMFTFQYNF